MKQKHLHMLTILLLAFEFVASKLRFNSNYPMDAETQDGVITFNFSMPVEDYNKYWGYASTLGFYNSKEGGITDKMRAAMYKFGQTNFAKMDRSPRVIVPASQEQKGLKELIRNFSELSLEDQQTFTSLLQKAIEETNKKIQPEK